jgi:hypothetical protein
MLKVNQSQNKLFTVASARFLMNNVTGQGSRVTPKGSVSAVREIDKERERGKESEKERGREREREIEI